MTDVSYGTAIGVLGLYLICPLFVAYLWSACNSYRCEILGPYEALAKGKFTKDALLSVLPVPTLFGFQLYFGWLAFQAVLYTILPAKIGYGQRTPAGHLLPYVVRLFTRSITEN